MTNDKGDTLPAPKNYQEAVQHWVWGFGPDEFPTEESAATDQ